MAIEDNCPRNASPYFPFPACTRHPRAPELDPNSFIICSLCIRSSCVWVNSSRAKRACQNPVTHVLVQAGRPASNGASDSNHHTHPAVHRGRIDRAGGSGPTLQRASDKRGRVSLQSWLAWVLGLGLCHSMAPARYPVDVVSNRCNCRASMIALHPFMTKLSVSLGPSFRVGYGAYDPRQ